MSEEKELTLEEAKKLLRIDKNSLDTMCVQHPELFFEVSDMCTYAIAYRDKTKEDMDQMWSTVATKLRKAEKITDKAVQELVSIDPAYIKAKNEFLDAKHEAERWSALKDAFMQRSGMIRSLCDLFVTGHYNIATVQSTKPRMAGYKQTREKIVGTKET